ncbi:bromodomain adjacent to zinc finger domain protein 1A-like [Homalodisca vitripennis]|uniref:bromodomain adjacent to zinc finger domain protein 1A-like n=1 Tax=Homalodisca vitripennis TaxID=197043 RepID=UPI001EEB1238|nr:bromodomain adjacent to zinc finger domain protein 1A-like [Homalodisca vitripennis]
MITRRFFYCELTNEIFRDYEEFCERIILCNSLVWACSLSGRAYLTYQEALASEESAKAMLNDFPMELRIPVLYLTTLTQRKSLNELAEDVYCFAKDRYFIGESVEVEIPGGSLTTCQILRVIQPSEEDRDSFKKQNVKNGERQYWPPGSLYRYEVQPVANEKSKPLIVSAELIHRKKSYYSRAKNRLYIKQFTEQVGGFWKLKVSHS